MRALIAIFPVFMSGCIALPIPYESIDNSTITGRVLDASTSQPIEGVRVRIGEPGSNRATAVTGGDGRFEILPVEKRHVWAVYPLAPIDVFGYCTDTISIYDNIIGGGYRSVSLEVHSCHWPFGRTKNVENLDIVDDLGDIRISMLPESG